MLGMILTQRILPITKISDTFSKDTNGGRALILPALDLLYILGTIDYHPKTDSIECLVSHETE